MANATMRRREFMRAGAAGGALAATPAWAQGVQPRRGGPLRLVGFEPPTFDIHASASFQTQLISSFAHRTLFKFAYGSKYGPSDFSLVPDIAQKAEVSRDGRVYTITLRRGIRWEKKAPLNGREVVAADVKYTWERALKKSPHAGFLGKIEAVETPDRYTVRVHLADAYAPFLHNLAEPWNAILPREVEEKMGDFRAAESLIGCGPFVLEKYEPGVKATFTRNPDYYEKGLPYLDRIEWLFLKDRATQLSLFRAGQIELPYYDGRIPRSETPSFKKSNPANPLQFWDGLAVRSFAFRTDKAPFNDVRIRRAFSLAIDRKKWVAQHLEGQGYEGHGPIPAPMREWTLPPNDLGPGARWLEYDTALAKKLLAEAGLPNGMKVKCTHWPGYGPELVEDLELLAFYLKAVGIELQIVNEEYGRYIRGSLRGKFDEVTWGPSSIFTEADGYLYNVFRSDEPNNRSRVSDTQLDVMLDAQRRYTAKSSRKKVIDDIQRHVSDQVYYVFTPYPKQVSSWSSRVKNLGMKNCFDKGAQLEVVWLEEPK